MTNLRRMWTIPMAAIALLFSVQVAMATTKASEELRRVEMAAAKIADHAAQLQVMAEEPSIYDVDAHEFEWTGIRTSLNEVGKLVPQLQSNTEAPAWQKEIIDQISGLLEGMATQTDAAIKYLSNNQTDTIRLMDNLYKARIASIYRFAQQVGDLAHHADARTNRSGYKPTS